MSDGITISETLQVNAVVWIRSLPESDLGPTRRILEDLEPHSRANGRLLLELPVANRDELTAAFQHVAELAAQGLRPILHVDAHGTADTGILLAPSGESAPWAEVIAGLRAINVATGNNLICVFALCFGLHLYKLVSLREPVPAYLFFAPSAKILTGELEARTLEFYRTIEDSGDVTYAFRIHFAEVMQQFHCQGLFLQALATFVRRFGRGKGKAAQQEKALTRLLKARGLTAPTRAQLQEARAKVREMFEPGQHLIDRFAPAFLIGREPQFNYEDVARVVAGASRRR